VTVTHYAGGHVNATDPARSHDGKRIVFVQVRSGPLGYADIFTMNAHGSDTPLDRSGRHGR
jgi:Tol biopolymer transport system component